MRDDTRDGEGVGVVVLYAARHLFMARWRLLLRNSN